MAEAVPKGNAKGRGPGYPVPSSGNSKLGQHGGEGKNAIKQTKTDIKFAKADCGPGRYL